MTLQFASLFLSAVPQALASDRDQELDELRRRVEALEEQIRQENAAPSVAKPGTSTDSAVELSPPWERESLLTPAPLRGVYDKPFLVSLWRKAYLGGYTEMEYHSFKDSALGVSRGFRAHRTNLFAYADISDSVRFGSEIEFENEAIGEDLEVKVEMAWVDWILFEELTLRGGAILVPLGRLNVNHDGPVREVTDRPLVSTFVIPTTLTEAGVGLHGRARLGGIASAVYEAYAVNGFNILDRDGELAAPITEGAQLLREGRPALAGDNNSAPAAAGRVAIQLENLLEAGGSWHVGTYDERNDNVLALAAVDFACVRGPLALEGELAWADFERDEFARTAGVPRRFWGYYLQASASHMPEFLRNAAPHVFAGEGSAFTLLLRHDWVDLDGDRAQAIEPGINFRPVADTVFKFSYRFGLTRLGSAAPPGRGADDDGFVFSLSTYF